MLKRILLPGLDKANASAFAIEFSVTTSDMAHFEHHGVVCPQSIRNAVPKRRAEFLAGRRAALAALREHGLSLHDIPIGEQRAPMWPPGFTGSITHCEGLAAAVVLPTTSARGIGIDAEELVTSSFLDLLEATVVDSSERAQLAGLAHRSGWPFALTLAFSAKESFYKATASTVGNVFDFDAIRIIGPTCGFTSVEVEVVETIAPDLPAGRRFVIGYRRWSETTLITCFAW